MDKNKKKGFTLVELIVVLAILAILAAMLVPALTGYIDKANEKKVIATARQYYVAAQTVVSEAYANGDEIKNIQYFSFNDNTRKIITINNDGVDKIEEDGKYVDEFVSLSEITKTTTSIGFKISKGKIVDSEFSIDGKYIKTDENGNLYVVTG